MKKSNYPFAVLILLGAIVLSCSKEEVYSENSGLPVFTFDESEGSKEYLGEYAKLFELTNASVQLQINTSPLQHARIFGRYQETLNGPRVDGGVFLFEDLRLIYDSSIQQYRPEEGSLDPVESYERISDYFGRMVGFQVGDDDNISDCSYYVPKELRVEIDNLSSNPNTNALGIGSNEKMVTWNADAQNENGVIAHLRFDGTSLQDDSSFDPENKITKAVKLADTGEGILPATFFEDIPEGGVFTLEFFRGAVSILKDNDNKDYKFYTLTKDKKNLFINL